MSEAQFAAPEKFDINRPSFKRKKDMNSQYILMYKDEPGVYYFEDGTICEDEHLARAAGYDVTSDKFENDRLAALRKANEEINSRFAQAREEIMNGRTQESLDAATESLSAPVEIPNDPVDRVSKRVWIEETGEVVKRHAKTGATRATTLYSMIHRGHGQWNIMENKTGKLVFENLKAAQAEAILDGRPVSLFED